MILSRLYLENFKKYTKYEIEFGEGLIGIIGKNGSGKSTIFEAILFALYGEPKTRGSKELIRNSNASTKYAVVIELDFEYESLEYKVIREFRGKALTANAKLFKNGDLIATGTKEVTSAIIRLTKMGKEAFIHTLFASQKELTSLSTLKNEDRKKIIRKLLGLEKIDFVEKELIERSRELKRDIDAFKEVLLGEDELKLKHEQIKINKSEKENLSKDEKTKTEELEHIKHREQEIKKALDTLAKTKEQKQKLFSELELLKNTKSLETMNQVKLIAQNHELEHKQEELKKLQPLIAEYQNLQGQLKEQGKLKEYHLKCDGLKKEQVSLREQYTKAKDDIHTLEKACEMYEQYTFDIKNLEQDLSLRQDAIEVKHTIEQELLLERAAEQRIIDEINSKITHLKELGKDSACPTCTRPLLDEYDNVINSLNEIVQGTHQKRIDEYNIQLKNVQGQKAKLVEQKQEKEKEHLELSKKISLIESKQKDLKLAKEHFNTVEQKGLKNKEELKELEQFNYNEKLHNDIKTNIVSMEHEYKHANTLETELMRFPLVKKELAEINKTIEALCVSIKNKDEEFKALIYDDVKHKHQIDEHDSILKVVETKTKALNEIKVQIAKIEGEIKTIQTSLDNNDVQLRKVQSKKDDLKDYEKIKTSLSEFKTKLNANVAPRISTIASEMYARITKGKYQHIEVSNDFDFFIYDDGKKYRIERYSGGEIDLANLVLRIAISKTLTELNGTSSIGFLAFDEVFGSQDETRRMEILEAFHTIKEQYRQIFLISHEMEIKEMFERVVEL